MQGHAFQVPATNASSLARWLWLSFAGVTFAGYVILVGSGSHDLGLRWIVGFVLVGWPTLAVGVTAALILPRVGREPVAPSFRVVVASSLAAWGVAALALEVGTTREYIPASLLWIALPTAVSATLVAVEGQRAVTRKLGGRGRR